MPTKYASHFSTVQTPQTQPIPGKAMVENSAGGFTFQVDDWSRLDRFLILGNDGGTYYASEKKLTVENAQCVLRCLSADFRRAIDRIVEISDQGRAPKNDPAIFALAISAGMGSPEARSYALHRMPEVCRIGTHLFQFVEAVQAFRGWGRGLKNGVARWYSTHRDPAYQIVKYQQRNGVSHRDVLRLCHGGNNSPLYRWAVDAPLTGRSVLRKDKGRTDEYAQAVGDLPPIVQAFEAAKTATTAQEICSLIEAHDLPRECIPTKWLNEPIVWEALLQKMPLNAMVRSLAKMTAVGLLAPMSQGVGKVIADLCDGDRLKKSRLHPVAILSALLTYGQGHGEKGKLTWSPVQQVVDALDGAFYKAFGNVPSTGKRWLFGCDVSGSMTSGAIGGVSRLTPRVATAALSLVTAAVEPLHHIMAFSNTFLQLPISPRQRLDDVCAMMDRLPFSSTDCSLPMVYAMQNKIPVDAFVVLTDNETYAGRMHPCQALQQYRQKMGIPAKLIVCGMTATEFTIADPSDFGMMDVVGFDTATPQLMADFAVDGAPPPLS